MSNQHENKETVPGTRFYGVDLRSQVLPITALTSWYLHNLSSYAMFCGEVHGHPGLASLDHGNRVGVLAVAPRKKGTTDSREWGAP